MDTEGVAGGHAAGQVEAVVVVEVGEVVVEAEEEDISGGSEEVVEGYSPLDAGYKRRRNMRRQRRYQPASTSSSPSRQE